MARGIGSEVEVRLFGQANVTYAGVPVKFARRSTTLAMLALLVLQRGKPMSRESLAFTLFPDVDESAALAELRRYLYLVNKALPPRADDPWIVADADVVRWNESAGAFVDVVEFERLSASAATQAQAVELYAGDLLADVYDDWVLAERERLRTRYLDVLAELLDRYRSERAYGAAIACAKRILSTDPWREDTLRALVAVRYESGDASGALAEYEQFVKRLRDELAIAPMPETVAVRRSIVLNEAVPGSLERPAASPDARPAKPISILPFVGRQRELAALRAAWTRAAHGTGSYVLIAGEAGVGKTRLAAELARTAQSEGGRVFVGTTSAPESMPYQAIVEALRSASPLLLARPPSAARRAVLARLLPELRDPSAPEFSAQDQTAERETARVFDALSHAVRTLASPRPLLLILEDLQWAGPAGIEALGAIVREAVRVPVLIVATCRDEETPVDHPLRALGRSLRNVPSVEELSLERLGEVEVADLITRVEGLRSRDATLARDLFAHSEGNALFLNEAINGVLEDSGASAHAGGEPGGLDSIARLVAARVDRLTEGARVVAEIAAVAGAGSSVSLIRDISNLPAVTVARGIDELLDHRILREASARGSHDYVFTHHLLAAALYDRIDPSFRAQRHARIARVLEAGYQESQGASSREIALHYERAGDGERAGRWYLTAARQSAELYAYGDAIELAGRALGVALSAEDRLAVLDLREKARGRRGDRSGQREDIDALETLAGDDPRARFGVLTRRVLLARALGDSEEEGRLISGMIALADGLGDEARAQALVERATHAGLRSRQVEGLEPARAALALYERLGDQRGQLDCLCLLVDFTTNVGDLPASREYLAQMRDRAASLADRAVEARALAVAGTAALLRQEYRECFDLTERALALNVATGDREAEAASRGRLAVTAVRLDDLATALREFERTLEAYGSMGHKRGLAITYTNRTTLLMRLGLFEEALDSIERSNAYFETVGEQRTIVANFVNASFVKLQRGDPEAARALAESALGSAREIGFPLFEAAALANLGNAERALGEFESAIGHMEAGIALRRPIQQPRDFADDLADLTLAYVVAGRKAEALRTARELEAIGTESFDGAFWPHYTWWAVASGLAAGGEDEAAGEAAARALAALRSFAAKIEDAATRAAFLELPVNQKIAAGL